MSRPQRIEHVLFSLLGIGTNYMVPVGLFLQIPLMQRQQPEGIRLASSMNVAVNTPIAISFLYVLQRSLSCRAKPAAADVATAPTAIVAHRSLRQDSLIVLCLVANVGAALLAAAAWHVTMGGASICLFCACFLAGTVGCMSAVILMPWISRYSAALIPAVNTGGAAGMVVLALVDAMEAPGAATPNFGASAFFGICALLACVPLVAYGLIYRRRRRQQPPQLPPSSCASEETMMVAAAPAVQGRHSKRVGELALATMRPDATTVGTAGVTPSAAQASATSDSSAPSMADATQMEVVVLEDTELGPEGTRGGRAGGGVASGEEAPTTSTTCSTAFSSSRAQVAPRALWHYCSLNFIVNMVCWGLQPALIPLAVRHTTLGEGGASEGPTLQACTMASAFCVTLGHFTTSRCVTYRLNALTFGYLCLTLIFLLAAFDVGDWSSAGAAAGVVLIVSASRFLDGFFTSLISLEICAAHAPAGQYLRKEHVLRVTGIAGSIGTLLGTLLSYALVRGMDEDASPMPNGTAIGAGATSTS
jgi:hypothetical protein